MSYSRSPLATAYPASQFDSNTFLHPEPFNFSGDGPQSLPLLQHSLLHFFSEFDAIVAQELRRPKAI